MVTVFSRFSPGDNGLLTIRERNWPRNLKSFSPRSAPLAPTTKLTHRVIVSRFATLGRSRMRRLAARVPNFSTLLPTRFSHSPRPNSNWRNRNYWHRLVRANIDGDPGKISADRRSTCEFFPFFSYVLSRSRKSKNLVQGNLKVLRLFSRILERRTERLAGQTIYLK